MPETPKDIKTYGFDVDPAPLNEYLHPRQPRRKKPRFSSIPGYNNDPSSLHSWEETLIQRHPMATTATYGNVGDPYEILKTPQDIKVGLPPLDPHLQYKISQRTALMISAYLAVTLPITALVFARIFTTSLVPLDPLFDFVIVFFMACVLTNVAVFARNHVNSVTKEMTQIAYQSTSIEMKEISAPVLTPVPSEATHNKYKQVMEELVNCSQEKTASQEPEDTTHQVNLIENEKKTEISQETSTIAKETPVPIAHPQNSPSPSVSRLARLSSKAKNILNVQSKESPTDDSANKQTGGGKSSRVASLRSLLNPKK